MYEKRGEYLGRDPVYRVRMPFMAVRRKPVFVLKRNILKRKRFGLRLQAITRLWTPYRDIRQRA